MLAKGGCRVLLFSRPNSPRQSWFSSSLHLERLLENLGGRSCFAAPDRFQVLTAESRLEIHGSLPFAEELRREHPAESQQLTALFSRLETLGQQLEETLWEGGGLPLWGLKGRFRFRLQCLANRLSWKGLTRPLKNLIEEYALTEAGATLRTLFEGLSLTPLEQLSVAEAALLWSSAIRADGVNLDEFEELLDRRFEQFHGRQELLSSIEAFNVEGAASPSVTLKKAGSCSADYFIFGHPEALTLLPDSLAKGVATAPGSRKAATTTDLQGMRPQLLAPRAILEAPHPLRLQIDKNKGLVEYAGTNFQTGDGLKDLRRLLHTALPFGDYRLNEAKQAPLTLPPLETEKKIKSGSFPGMLSSVRCGNRLFLCHGGSILPTLATTGELMTGVTIAKHLLNRIKV